MQSICLSEPVGKVLVDEGVLFWHLNKALSLLSETPYCPEDGKLWVFYPLVVLAGDRDQEVGQRRCCASAPYTCTAVDHGLFLSG